MYRFHLYGKRATANQDLPSLNPMNLNSVGFGPTLFTEFGVVELKNA